MLVSPSVSALYPSAKWLLRGLSCAYVGGRVWNVQFGWAPLNPTGAPKSVPSKFGIAGGFSSLGGGTTDRLSGGKLYRPSSGWRTIVGHVYPVSAGGGSLGRVFQDISGNGATKGETLSFDGGGGTMLSYQVFASTQRGQWNFSSNLGSGAWHSFAITQDQRTVGTTPTGFVDGVAVSVTTSAASIGSYETADKWTDLTFGNRASDSARVWDGLIGPVLFFDGLLTGDEIASLHRDPLQVFDADEQFVWIPDAGGGGAAELIGSAASQASATGALTTQIPLSGAAAEVATANGALTTQIPLAGAAASVAVANGVLTATIQLSGAALAQVVASATLAGGAAALSGSAAESVTATGTLTTQITLSGAAVAQALATAGLTTDPSGLAGSAAATASSSGALSTGITLVGQASALAVSAGGLTTGIPLAGSAVSVSAATGELTVSSGFGAAALMQATASGTLSTQVRLNAAAVAQALATGILSSGAWVPVADPRYTASMIAPDRTFTATERTWQAVVT